MDEKVLELRGLQKLYKNGRGVESLSFDVYRGDVVGLLGPNGSGKTTTMKVIAGLCNATGGTVKIFGSDIEESLSLIHI